MPASLRQFTGALSPVPRGSKPTMSKCSSNGSPNHVLPPAAYDVPAAPGPPGLTTSDPMRDPEAGTRSTASRIERPPGCR